MRIAIDARVLQDRYHGIARYTDELIRALAALRRHVLILLTTDEPASRLSAEAHAHDARLVGFAAPVVSLREQRRWPGLLRRLRPDVLFVPYHLATPWASSVPVVTVIHDTIFEDGASQPPKGMARLLYRRATRLALRGATTVATVSHATRERVRFHYDYEIPPRNVVLHGVDPRFYGVRPSDVDVARARLKLPAQYFLHLGARRPHKNVPLLIEAFRPVAERVPGLDLVLAGASDARFDDPVPRMIAQWGLEKRILLLEDVPEQDLVGLLRGALGFVFPSVTEGFGLPVLEALAAGVPVIASTAPAVLEAGGEATISLPPDDPGAWTEAMCALAFDRGLRADLIARGRAVAERRTWDTAGRAMEEILVATASGGALASRAAIPPPSPAAEPAIGSAGSMHPRGRRRRLLAIGALVLVGLVLMVGRLTRDPAASLGAPSAAWVVKGSVLRSGQPRDIDFANMRDILGVTGVVNLRTDLTGERLVVEGFSMGYLHIPVPRGGVPEITDLERLTTFLREHTTRGPVLIHDEFGDDSAPALGAALAVLHGQQPRAAIKDAQDDDPELRLTSAQIAFVNELGERLGNRPFIDGRTRTTTSPVTVPNDIDHLVW